MDRFVWSSRVVGRENRGVVAKVEAVRVRQGDRGGFLALLDAPTGDRWVELFSVGTFVDIRGGRLTSCSLP